jgi:hypothetical protein
VTAELSSSPLLFAAVVLGALGAILILAGIVSLLRARLLRFAVRTLTGLLLISLGVLAGGVALGLQGYRALTREDLAARLTVQPSGKQRFATTFRYPDGREVRFDVAGDEIYVDAHILKWKPLANLLGLHTSYELGRLAGRYRDIEQERSADRTVYSLGQTRAVDLFDLRQRYTFLSSLMDVDYGSATFVPVTQPAELELRVSTTGLLMRETK